MSVVRLTIEIEDICRALEDFNFIDIYRSQTKWGTYTKITNTNTRIKLCPEQNFYDYDDNNGSEYHWYKYQLVDTSGNKKSNFSEPTQAYTPDITYCKFTDVRRLLRSKSYEGTIRFSDSYRNLRKGDESQDVYLKAISVNPNYSGTQPYIITFLNATDFKLEVNDETSYAKKYLGQGSISADFIAEDNSIKIYSSDWSGVPVAGNTVLFDTDSHMSISDAILFIKDAETLVDVILEENISYLTAKDTTTRFERNTVPKAVEAATSRFAAFFIYTTIYNEQSINGLPNNINDITVALSKRENDLSSWVKQAMKYLDGYVKKYTSQFDPESGLAIATAPRWINDPIIFNASGVYNVGDGVFLPDKDKIFNREEMTYNSLLDWDLMIPYINQYLVY